MPRHKKVTTCLRGGPVSTSCSCQHCQLCVCELCGAYEGGLTTDCPGMKVSFDRQQEVHETNLDYTDDRGWHQGEPSKRRTPHFEDTKIPPQPAAIDPRTLVAPGVDWAAIDRNMNLQHELSLKAIAWVLAERACDDCAAKELRAKEAAAHLHGKALLDDHDQALLTTLEGEKKNFSIACRLLEKRDDEFHQTARKLVEALDESPIALGLLPPPDVLARAEDLADLRARWDMPKDTLPKSEATWTCGHGKVHPLPPPGYAMACNCTVSVLK